MKTLYIDYLKIKSTWPKRFAKVEKSRRKFARLHDLSESRVNTIISDDTTGMMNLQRVEDFLNDNKQPLLLEDVKK